MLSTALFVTLSALGTAPSGAPPAAHGAPAARSARARRASPLRLPMLASSLNTGFSPFSLGDYAMLRAASRQAQTPPRAGTGPAAAGGVANPTPPASGTSQANADAQTAPPAGGDTPASAGGATANTPNTAEQGSGSGDGGSAQSEEEPDIELLRHRAQLTRIHRIMGITTWGSYLFTQLLGTIRLINMPTWFGNGNCQLSAAGRVEGILGEFGCNELTAVHAISSFVTTALYTTTLVLATSMPDPERAGEGNDRRAGTLRAHRILRWIHLAGMVMMPVLGIVSAHLIQGDAAGRAMRTIHGLVGYTTFTALTVAMVIELL